MSPKKYRLLLALIAVLILFPFPGNSQTFPPYHLTIYDSTVTGFYFLATKKMGTNQAGYNPMQLVINEKGEVVYYKSVLPYSASPDFKVQPNGKISYYKNNKFIMLDSTFTVVDSITCVGYHTDAHDLQVLNNNHYLLFGHQDSIMDLSAYPYFNNNGSPGSTNATVTGSVIQELDSNKNVVFEWHALNHFQFDDVDEYWMKSPTDVDWTHTNAVELDTDGNILISSRHFNEITKIDRATGNILWRLGGKENQFTFINDSLIFRGQHDIRRIANGNITLYDNGNYTVPHGARGVEYALDEINKTATLVWSYGHDPNMYSKATGNNQRVGGSRKLINYGHRAYGNLYFSFVDSLNNPISELSFTDSSNTYRAFFYPSLPWSFHHPKLSCDMQGTDLYLTPTRAYSSYLWSTGATTASIQVTVPGTYYVYVPYGEGFIRSENFEVMSITNSCSPRPDAAFTANITSVCKNTTVTFTDQSMNNPTTWQWNFPGGTPSSSTLQNPQVQYSTAGIYSVSLVAGNQSGYGSEMKTNYIQVNGSPAASITANGPLNFCTGGSVLLSANLATGLTYQWKKANNNISGAASSTYTVTVAGSYKVVVTNQNGCTKISNTLSITGPPSTAITTTGSPDLCPGDSVKFEVPFATGNLYQWKKDNINISGATTNIYYASVAGDFKVKVTNPAGCSKSSAKKTVTTNCKLEDVAIGNSDQIKIFPNPASKYFNITLNSNHSYEMLIYDLSGKKIENHIITDTDNFIFGKNLEAGFYFCEIFYENKRDLFQVVKVAHEF